MYIYIYIYMYVYIIFTNIYVHVHTDMMYIYTFKVEDYVSKCSTSEEKKRRQATKQAATRYPK